MKHLKLKQGDGEWIRARLGKPTASRFKEALTTVKGDARKSKTRLTYLYQLAAEQIWLQPMYKQPKIEQMEKGKQNEPFAAAAYGIEHGPLDECGLFLRDDLKIGASPDRIVRANPAHIVEIKCPTFPYYLRRLLDEDTFELDYKPQLQGQLWVCEKEKVFLVGYVNELPMVRREVGRDDDYIAKMEVSLAQFVAEIEEVVAQAKRRGVLVVPESFKTPLEHHYPEATEIDVVEQE